MKNLLIATDFSPQAKHAAEYGYSLAKQLKANVLLCNALIVPAEISQAGMVACAMEEQDIMEDGSNSELQRLKAHLEITDHTDKFRPAISYVNETGSVPDVVNNQITDKTSLVVMSTHGGDFLGTLLLGDHSKNMIDCTTQLLLLVPPAARAKPVKKIAFATDFKTLDENVEAIYKLIPLAHLLNAEILITHVHHDKEQSQELLAWLREFIVELSNCAGYPNIYYRIIENTSTEDGLDWLCEHGDIDVLAMLHGKYDFIDRILTGSHTQKMAGHIQIPLLVIPAG
jgi:nucleotide-binding universal stress UspA family protein